MVWVEELTLSVGWGGTADHPTWRIAIERANWPDEGPFLIDETEGRGPAVTEHQVDEVVGVLMAEAYRLFRDQFVVLCEAHGTPRCPECSWGAGRTDDPLGGSR